jgi:hypothetical protein
MVTRLTATVALALVALPAGAATIVATGLGLLGDGSDLTAVFDGNPGDPFDFTYLEGQSFSYVVAFDTALGTAQDSPIKIGRYGGELYGPTDPIMSAILNINGASQRSSGDDFGAIPITENLYRTDANGCEAVSNSLCAEHGYGEAIFDNPVLDLEAPFSLDATGLKQYGNSSVAESTCHEALSCILTVFALGEQVFTSLSEDDGADVTRTAPLPASGLLLLPAPGSSGVVDWRYRQA